MDSADSAGEAPGGGGAFDSGFDGRVYAESDGVSRPQVVRKVEPQYSEEARKQKFSGTVVLRIVVDANGNVVNAKVITSVGWVWTKRPSKPSGNGSSRPATKTANPSPWP